MSVAQKLYENGWITYMRTDSTTLLSRLSQPVLISSDLEINISQTTQSLYFQIKMPRYLKAIRPYEFFRHYKDTYASLDQDEGKLYELIWQNGSISMENARGQRVRIYIS